MVLPQFRNCLHEIPQQNTGKILGVSSPFTPTRILNITYMVDAAYGKVSTEVPLAVEYLNMEKGHYRQ